MLMVATVNRGCCAVQIVAIEIWLCHAVDDLGWRGR